MLQAAGRQPADVRRSLMTGCVFGRNDAEVQRRLSDRNRTRDDLRSRGVLVGTASEMVDQLGVLAEAGVQRVMLQWLDLDDLDGLTALAHGVLPQVVG
jgi:alkanesulfonate monooxygenase SsuD/methylene tetrahydromethanopterin reductase-like flavin-dependent oxidoreductase (luciferase family)